MGESYIFIQKSMGSTADFAKVNREFEFMREALCKEFAIREDDINTQDTASLSQTLARVMTERFQTWSDHVNQWEQAGKTFESTFEPTNYVPNEDEMKAMEAYRKQYCQKRRKFLAQEIQGEPNDDEIIEWLDISTGLDLYMAASAHEKIKTYDRYFVNRMLVQFILKETASSIKNYNSQCLRPEKINNNANRLASYMSYVCRALKSPCEDTGTNVFDYMLKKTGALQPATYSNAAGLLLGENLLSKLLWETDPTKRKKCVIQPGSFPFYNGVLLAQEKSLCEFWIEHLQQKPGATKEQRTLIHGNRLMVAVILKDNTNKSPKIDKVFECPKQARMLVTKIMLRNGLKMKYAKSVILNNVKCSVYSMEIQDAAFAYILSLKNEYIRGPSIMKMKQLMVSDNLSPPDKEWMTAGINLYNAAVDSLGTPDVSPFQIEIEESSTHILDGHIIPIIIPHAYQSQLVQPRLTSRELQIQEQKRQEARRQTRIYAEEFDATEQHENERAATILLQKVAEIQEPPESTESTVESTTNEGDDVVYQGHHFIDDEADIII